MTERGNVAKKSDEPTVNDERRFSDLDEADSRWFYFRVGVDQHTQKLMCGLGNSLIQVRQSRDIRGWWWLVKQDIRGVAIRLRICVSEPKQASVVPVLQDHLTRKFGAVTTPMYEPEHWLFGGQRGVALAHMFMCADSELAIQWHTRGHSGRPRQPLLPPGLSLCLLMNLFRQSQLDVFECADVFRWITHQRPLPDSGVTQELPIGRMANLLRADAAQQYARLYRGRRRQLLTQYYQFQEHLGREIALAHTDGLLERGIRSFLGALTLFHWNRVALTYVNQALLGRAILGSIASLVDDGDDHESRPHA